MFYALAPTTDMRLSGPHVRSVPKAEVVKNTEMRCFTRRTAPTPRYAFTDTGNSSTPIYFLYSGHLPAIGASMVGAKALERLPYSKFAHGSEATEQLARANPIGFPR